MPKKKILRPWRLEKDENLRNKQNLIANSKKKRMLTGRTMTNTYRKKSNERYKYFKTFYYYFAFDSLTKKANARLH